MTELGDIRVDVRSTIASRLHADLLKLQANDALTSESATAAIVLAIARLEACVFGELEDPVTG